MIGGLFTIVAAYGIVLWKALKPGVERDWAIQFDRSAGYSFDRQLDIELAVGSSDPAKQKWVESRLGYKVASSCMFDRMAACKKLLEMEGLQYTGNYYLSLPAAFAPAYRKAHGRPKPTEGEIKGANEVLARLEEGARWRELTFHGKDVAVSPYRFRNKFDYFNAVELECKRLGIWGNCNVKSADWKKHPDLSLKKHGCEYLCGSEKLDPDDYMSEDDFLYDATKLDAQYRQYKVFLKGGLVKRGDDLYIDQFNEQWDKTRATCESDEACAVSIYQMIGHDGFLSRGPEAGFAILEDKCNMLGLSFSDIAQAASE